MSYVHTVNLSSVRLEDLIRRCLQLSTHSNNTQAQSYLPAPTNLLDIDLPLPIPNVVLQKGSDLGGLWQ